MIRKVILMALGLVLILSLGMAGWGCGGGASSTVGGPDPGQIRILAASSGSQTFLGMGLMADQLRKGLERPVGAFPGASRENLPFVNRGEAEVSYLSTIEGTNAWNGEGLFEGKEKMRNIRSWIGMVPDLPLACFTRMDSGIESIADLNGKRVGIGTKGSWAEVYALMAMEAGYGVTQATIEAAGGVVARLSYGAMRDQLADRSIDAIWLFATGDKVSPYAMAVEETVGARWVGLTDEAIAKIKSVYPFFAVPTAKGGLYKGNPDPIKVVAATAIIAVRGDMSEDLVYKMTGIQLEEKNRKAVATRIINWPLFGEPEVNFVGLDAIPMHKGAYKWYQDNGWPIPASIKTE